MQMTDSEIRTKARDGTPINILAQLNACDSQKIKKIIELSPSALSHKKTDETPIRIDLKKRAALMKSMYEQGKTDQAIATELNLCVQSVYKWRRNNSLPSVTKVKKQQKGRISAKKTDLNEKLEEEVDPDPYGTVLKAVAEEWVQKSEAQFIELQTAREQEQELENKKISLENWPSGLVTQMVTPMYFADLTDKQEETVFPRNLLDPQLDKVAMTEKSDGLDALRYALQRLKDANNKVIAPGTLKPRDIHERERILDIKKTIYFALNNKKSIPREWILEYNELIERQEKPHEEIRNHQPLDKNRIIDEKPEGVPSELADVVIRIADMCGLYGIDLEAAIIEKMAYNKSRPYRHGGKAL